MPTYEFRCPSGHDFEKFFRKISVATNELPCPECGQVASRRLSAGTGLLFKGSGFYLTDYGRSGSKNGAEGGSDAGKESKSDAKKPDAAATGTTPSGSEKPAAPKSDTGKGPKDPKST
jgi:putative FmdB family regulatory protein